MRNYSSSELTWRGDMLHLGRKALDVSIVPDANYPGMWRVRVGTKLSDMANRTRARAMALAILNRQETGTALALAN